MTPQQQANVEEVEFLRDLAPMRIAERLGTTESALARSLYRAGRPDLARMFNTHNRARTRRNCDECDRPIRGEATTCITCRKAAA